MTTEWTEAEIAAWIDGQLHGPEAERIARLVNADAKAAAYAEAVRNSNKMLKAAFDEPLDSAATARIWAVIDGHPLGSAGPLAAQPRRPRRQFLPRPAALAASIALVIGLAAGLGAGGMLWQQEDGGPMIAAPGPARSGEPLHTALETLPSGSVSDSGVRPMLTFRDAEGRPCREFEIVDALPRGLELGIACRNPAGDWHVHILVAAPQPEVLPETGFTPAAGPAGDALGAMLDALGAGLPLTPQEEGRLRDEGWTP